MAITYTKFHNSGLEKNLFSKHMDHGFVQTFLTEAKLLGKMFEGAELEAAIEKCKDITDATLDFFLALDGEALAGVLAVSIHDRREIGMLWVEEDYRRKKVGKRLVELFKEDIAPLPMKVECLKGNIDGLVFYESLGFEFVDKARFPTNLVGYTKVKFH